VWDACRHCVLRGQVALTGIIVAESTIACQSVPRSFPLLRCEKYPKFPALDGRNSQGICSLRVTITPCRMHTESPVQTSTCLSSGFLANGLPMKKIPKTIIACARVRQDPAGPDMTGGLDVLTEKDPLCIVRCRERHSLLLRMWASACILRLFGAHGPKR
jgi:hypothetical protein